MDCLVQLAEEDAEFVELLLELTERLPRLDVKRWIRLMEEEMQDIICQARAA